MVTSFDGENKSIKLKAYMAFWFMQFLNLIKFLCKIKIKIKNEIILHCPQEIRPFGVSWSSLLLVDITSFSFIGGKAAQGLFNADLDAELIWY